MATVYSKCTKYSNYPIKSLSYLGKCKYTYGICDYYLEKKDSSSIVVCVIQFQEEKYRVHLPSYISKHLKSRRKMKFFLKIKLILLYMKENIL